MNNLEDIHTIIILIFTLVINIEIITVNTLFIQFFFRFSKIIISVLYRVSAAEITLPTFCFGLSCPVGFAPYCYFLICAPFAIDMRILRYFFVTFSLNSGGRGLTRVKRWDIFQCTGDNQFYVPFDDCH